MHNSSVYPKHILPAVEPMYDLKQLHFYNYFIARLCSVYGSAVERGYRITLDSNFKYAESHRQAYKRLARVKQAVWFSYFTCNMSKNNGDSILIKHKPGFKKNVKCVKFNLKPLVKVYVKSRGIVDGDSREVSFYKILKGSGAVPWRLLGLKKTYYVYVVNRYGTYGTGP